MVDAEVCIDVYIYTHFRSTVVFSIVTGFSCTFFKEWLAPCPPCDIYHWTNLSLFQPRKRGCWVDTCLLGWPFKGLFSYCFCLYAGSIFKFPLWFPLLAYVLLGGTVEQLNPARHFGPQAAGLYKQIVDGVQHIHQKRCAHRASWRIMDWLCVFESLSSSTLRESSKTGRSSWSFLLAFA